MSRNKFKRQSLLFVIEPLFWKVTSKNLEITCGTFCITRKPKNSVTPSVLPPSALPGVQKMVYSLKIKNAVSYCYKHLANAYFSYYFFSLLSNIFILAYNLTLSYKGTVLANHWFFFIKMHDLLIDCLINPLNTGLFGLLCLNSAPNIHCWIINYQHTWASGSRI